MPALQWSPDAAETSSEGTAWNPTFAIGAQDSFPYPLFLIVIEYPLFFEIC